MKQPLAVGFVVGAALKLEFLWVMKELSYRCGAPPCTKHVLTLRVIPSCQDHQAAIPSCQDHHAGPDEISYQRPWSKTHIPPFGGNQFGKEGTITTSSTFWPQCQEHPYQTGASCTMGAMDLSPGRASKAIIHRTKHVDKASRMASLCMAKQASM